MNTMPPALAEKTMELLWTRVRQRGDLPGFSKVVNAIVGAMHGDDDREFNMTKTVLQDPALTQKVLRLANSAMYSVFGQNINTVSKAVIVLGTETIGHLALGLKLVDGLSNASAESVDARAEMEKAVLAGYVARQVVSAASTRDAEEAVVCSILHSLGRMMVTFYLSDRWQQVRTHCAATGVGEAEAVRELLGLDLDDLGRRVARQWGLPPSLVETLHDVAPKRVAEPLEHRDWLAAVSSLAGRCAVVLCEHDGTAQRHLHGLAADYADMLGLEAVQIIAAVDAGQKAAADDDAIMVGAARRGNPEKPAGLPGKPADAVAILRRGVADMRDALHSMNTAQLISMALETVYQGLGFQRAIAFVRNKERAHYEAHLGLGAGVQDLLPRLTFDEAYQPDVFHAALANDKMIFVENALNPTFGSRLPRWWKEALPTARSFIVLPLTIKHNAVGFIYGDWDDSSCAARIEHAEIALLNSLRTLLMQSMEMQPQAEPSWIRQIR